MDRYLLLAFAVLVTLASSRAIWAARRGHRQGVAGPRHEDPLLYWGFLAVAGFLALFFARQALGL
jgi:hypothetical protein